MKAEFFTLSINTLKRRKLRSWLTMLGIFIGIATLVSLVSLGQGLEEAVQEQFSQLGTDKLIIEPKGTFGGLQTSTVTLTKRDSEVVERVLGVKESTGLLFKTAIIEFNEQIHSHFAFGIPTDEKNKLAKEFFFFKIEEGRDLRKGDKNKVVLGQQYKDPDLFDKKITLRDKIIINGEEFKIVGFYKTVGNTQDDSSVTISEDAFRELYNLSDEFDIIVAKVDQGSNPRQVADRVEKELRNFRDVKEGKEDFTVSTAEEFLETFQEILNIITVFLLGIASISLFVGGVGIMNTMYTSVVERTQEIGVMKAIGARNIDIASLFMIESGLLGMAGGSIGVVLGFAVAKGIELLVASTGNTILQTKISLTLIIGALLFSFIVGTVSGVLPAIRASKLPPTEALRYE